MRGPRTVLSNVIATQHELHEAYAGVVPEIASRAHLERIAPVVTEALREAGAAFGDLDAIAVGNRPGLIGSLLVGVSAAKALAWALGRPLIGIDHVHAHLVAGVLGAETLPAFPALGLVVSGGHTSLYRVPDLARVELLGRTIDDALGEAYDKSAAILGLGYPGGPALDALAQTGDDRAYDFPVAALARERLDFSFSGLKTALLYAACGQPRGRGAGAKFSRDASALSRDEKADLAASFQRAAVTAVIRKLRRAIGRHPDVRTLLVGGGVSANRRLRAELAALAADRGLDLRLPAPELCVDNAAMIAGMAMIRFERGDFDDLALGASARSAVTAHA